jgi:hypothetical protein
LGKTGENNIRLTAGNALPSRADRGPSSALARVGGYRAEGLAGLPGGHGGQDGLDEAGVAVFRPDMSSSAAGRAIIALASDPEVGGLARHLERLLPIVAGCPTRQCR